MHLFTYMLDIFELMCTHVHYYYYTPDQATLGFGRRSSDSMTTLEMSSARKP